MKRKTEHLLGKELDTRGTLFNEIIRIAEIKKPKYMLLENVKGLTNKRHRATFEKILDELFRIGYSVDWKVLNSKEHGIPQNRERVFFVCVRKGITLNNSPWPEQEELKIFLKDVLEDVVDDKYLLSELMLEKLTFNEKTSGEVANLNKGGQKGSVYSEHSKTISCLTATDYKQPKQILIKNATKKGYLKAFPGDGVSLEHPESKTRRGRVQSKMIATLQCNDARGVVTEELNIRKLTATEYFRLMGFKDGEINLEGLSNTQRYKLAGNGWDINLISKIFRNIYK